jgi:oxalate---CoA ligase
LTGTARKLVGADHVNHFLQTNIHLVDDDQIETLLSVRFHDFVDPTPELQSSEASPSASQMGLDTETSLTHGTIAEGQIGCCRRESNGLVDCLRCLDEVLSTFLQDLDSTDADLIRRILKIVSEAGAKGVSKDQLFVGV